MSEIKVIDKVFEPSITAAQIQKRVSELAVQINRDMVAQNPLFLAVLNGSFMFVADLYRHITIESEISFVKLASYDGTSSTGVVNEVIGLNKDIKGRNIVIVEDIIDTGFTMQQMLKTLAEHHPASIRICTLLQKPDKLQVPIKADYVAFNIPNLFVVGYGLDYDQQGRNLPAIYVLKED